MFEHNLRLLFPQLESLPHSDTLFRLLSRIDVSQIEQAAIGFIRNTLTGPWLDPQAIEQRLARPLRLRLV